MYEFRLYQLAYQVKQNERTQDLALQAWLNQSVQATKGSGKNVRPVYKTFTEFYDAAKQHERIFKGDNTTQKKRELTMADMNRKLNERR